jgi:DNA polymerase I-like protein with 3'-5' exonuclease and polymerase domains
MAEIFEFGMLQETSTRKDIGVVRKDILLHHQHSGKDNHLLFLVETSQYTNQEVKGLVQWINQNVHGFNYDVVAATPLDVDIDFIRKRTIYKFYQQNSSNFMQYVKPGSTIIIPLGIALSAITKSDDLNTECFYDYVFNKTYFYSPQTDTYVYPIDGFLSLFKFLDGMYRPKDCSRLVFAEYQLNWLIKNYDKFRNPPDIDRLIINEVKSESDFRDMLHINRNAPKVAQDLETSGFNFRKDIIGCLTASYDGSTGWFVPWEFVDIDAWSEHIKDKVQIYQNGKFDIKFAKHQGVRNLRINSDTLQLGQTLNEMRFNSLKSLAYYYTPYGGYDKPLDDYIAMWKPATYLDIPNSIKIPYATKDAIETFRIEDSMQKQLTWLDSKFPPIHEKGWTIREFYEKVKLPTVNTFIDIEMRGFSVDLTKWETNSRILQSKIDTLRTDLEGLLNIKSANHMTSSFDQIFFSDEDFMEDESSELQSSQKLGKILEAAGWECLGRAKNGGYLTGDDILKRWAQTGHPEAKKIQSLRSYLTLQKTFMGKLSDPNSGWQFYISKFGDGDYRICPSYKSMLTETMRNACGDPNYQQVPSQAQDAQLFKEIMSTPDINKYYLMTLDYASLQMRLATIDSEDPVLMKAYQKDPDLDLHTKTGFNIFCKNNLFSINQIRVIEKDKTYIFFPFEEIKILRDGKEVISKAENLEESDILI